MQRTIFDSEHDQLREVVRKFVETEVLPRRESAEQQGFFDRDLWTAAARSDC